jgi:hypothetical protein
VTVNGTVKKAVQRISEEDSEADVAEQIARAEQLNTQ